MDIKAASALSQKLLLKQTASKNDEAKDTATRDDDRGSGGDDVQVKVSDGAENAAKRTGAAPALPKGLAELNAESANLVALNIAQRMQEQGASFAGNAEQSILALMTEEA